LKRVLRFFESIFFGIIAVSVCFSVIVLACFQYIFKTEKEPIRYSRNGKVVNLDDFRADKAGREL
jgi:hypothetical protein